VSWRGFTNSDDDAVEIREIWEFVRAGGTDALLALFILGLYRRWVVMGWQHTDIVAERDYWRGKYEAAFDTASRAITICESQVTR
jgi:hypothetical protein